MDRCRSAGLTASEVVRDLIESEMLSVKPRRSSRAWQALAAAVAGIVIGAAAAPSIAQALPGSHAAFDRIDANHDGVLTLAEFNAR